MRRGALLCALLGSAPAFAQQVSEEPLPLYPDAARWMSSLSAATPALQDCIDAAAPPRAVVAVLEVPPSGEPVVRSIDPAPAHCLSTVLQSLRFGPHHEDTVVLDVRFPLVGGAVQNPLEVRLDGRESGPLFLYLGASTAPAQRTELQQAVDDWLSDRNRPGDE